MLSTVNPKYIHHWKLFPLLAKLRIVGIRRHSISLAATMIAGNMNKLVKPHWIPLAVVSLNSEYLEITAMKKGEFSYEDILQGKPWNSQDS